MVAAAVLAFAAQGAFAYFGAGVTAGSVQTDKSDLDNEMSYFSSVSPSYSGSIEDNNSVFGAEAFYETSGINRFGVSLGYKGIAANKLNQTIIGQVADIKANAKSVPINLYWKYQPEDSKFAFRLGGGADIMTAKTTINDVGTETEYTQTKLVPHIDAGAEWYFLKNVSLGLNIGCLIGGKFDELENGSNKIYTTPQSTGRMIVVDTSMPDGGSKYVQDYSGVRADIALRVYFGN